jgi:uncharacterized protein YecE (DUF72 family)
MSKVQSIASKQRKRAYRALHIGTSGWTYDDWRGRFYPKALPRKDWLAWYSTRFSSTEINGSFYRTPSIEAVQTWRDTTPAHFQFAWKASKFITHWKRLSPKSKNSIELMMSRLAVLGRKCGPVLFQLPSRFKVDHDRLAQFLDMLPSTYEYAFEFRHDSWYEQSIFLLLENNNVALCISDHHQAPAPWIATARHAYIRGHGPTGRYKGSYPQSTLQDWATRIGAWRNRQKKSVYVYFDNDQKSAAPKDAARLRALLCVG